MQRFDARGTVTMQDDVGMDVRRCGCSDGRRGLVGVVRSAVETRGGGEGAEVRHKGVGGWSDYKNEGKIIEKDDG